MGLQLARVKIGWSGPQVVGLAMNVIYFAADVGPPNPAAITTAYNALNAIVPVSVVKTVPNSGDVVDDANGHLLSTWVGTGGSANGGSAANAAAAGVGACVTWHTGAIVGTHPHLLRGRTFIVPLATSAYDVDGTLTSVALTGLNNFATALMAAGPLGVWHRPTSPGGTDGTSHGVVSYSITDRVAFLSSRRQ